MGQVSQLVLLATIVASYITASAADIVEPDDPSDTDPSDFPEEFMKNLIASLSPEEREELKKPKNLEDSHLGSRYGSEDEKPCKKIQGPSKYYKVKATDNYRYYVVNDLQDNYQPIIYFLCNDIGPDANKCSPPTNSQSGYNYCCRQDTTTIFLTVIPKPVSDFEIRNGKLFLKGQDVPYEIYETVQKEVYVRSDCVCVLHRTSMIGDVCPAPTSGFPFERI